MAQERINDLLVHRAQEGYFVVRLKGGDPYIFGRGYEELLELQEAGVPVRVIPGISSTIAVPGSVGIPVTLRKRTTTSPLSAAMSRQGTVPLRSIGLRWRKCKAPSW